MEDEEAAAGGLIKAGNFRGEGPEGEALSAQALRQLEQLAG